MLDRRRFLCAAAALPAATIAPLAGAAPLADVLERPALAIRLASKPAMNRIARAGDRLVAVGERGVVLLSDDDGHTWRQARVPVSVSLTGVQFVDARRGFAIGHACVVLATDNGGESWKLRLDGRAGRVPVPGDALDKPLLGLFFTDSQRGWVVGADGIALDTSDGGATWRSFAERLPNPKSLHLYALARQGRTLYIAGERGTFLALETDDPSAHGIALETPYRGTFFAMLAMPGDVLVLGGLRGTALERNAAGDFRRLDTNGALAIVALAPLAENRLALVDLSGRVLLGSLVDGRFRSTPIDATRRWTSVALARDGTLVGACNVGTGRVSA